MASIISGMIGITTVAQDMPSIERPIIVIVGEGSRPSKWDGATKSIANTMPTKPIIITFFFFMLDVIK